MKLLLDTHALLWWALGSRSLSQKARRAIGTMDTEVYVSSASVWEIATKVRLGKLDWPAEAGSLSDYVFQQGFKALPISLEHSQRAGGLPIDHRDPFDRMLIAQAQIEGLLLVSNEAIFDEAGVTRYW